MPLSNEQRARQLAEAFRREHGLGQAAITDVFELFHVATDVDIFSIDADESEHGLLMLHPGTGRRAVAIATMRSPMRQRSSVAHELGHLLRGDLDGSSMPSPPGERSPAEICADAFARHLLLPSEALTDRVATTPTLSDLSELVQEFGVSPSIAAIQLSRSKLISSDQCDEWKRLSARELASRFGWRSHYTNLTTAALTPRAPQRLMKRAVTGYQSGVLSLTELANWYGVEAETLRHELGDPADGQTKTQVGSGEEDWGLDAALFPESDEDALA